MTSPSRDLAALATAAVLFAGACVDGTAVAPDIDPADPAEAASVRGPLPTAHLAPRTRAPQVRAWAGHPPGEYRDLVGSKTPGEHPGIPFYARVGFPPGFPEGQIIEAAGRVVVVFYRTISCIPEDFNLLDFFHFPGPGGPGAYQCPAYQTGVLYTEPDASPMTFPKIVDLEGSEVPIWMVDAEQFHAAAADGALSISELAALDRIERTVHTYDEHIHPRHEDHFIGIDAKHDPDTPGFRFRLEFEGLVTSEGDVTLWMR